MPTYSRETSVAVGDQAAYAYLSWGSEGPNDYHGEIDVETLATIEQQLEHSQG